MIGVVATIKVRDGTGEQFEAVAKELVAAVRANEPGCLLYALHRTEDPGTYVFMERYRDEAALEAHRGTEHFRRIGRRMGAFMDGPPQILRLQELE